MPTDAVTSARMAKVRQAGTWPELALRRYLTARGVRYRTNNRDLSGRPDLANRRRRWAVFVHGCFWHGHERCKKASIPKRNSDFWVAKIEANRLRDARAEEALRSAGYDVVTVWECKLSKSDEINARKEPDEIACGLGRVVNASSGA